jgi:hypothetical protein
VLAAPRAQALVLPPGGCALGSAAACFPPCAAAECGAQLGLRIGEALAPP